MTFKNVTEAKQAINRALRTDVASYIKYLDKQSPVYSDSHYRLRALYQSYGMDAVDAEVDRQFAHQQHVNTTATCGNCNRSWCVKCDPCPSAQCHWCNGRGYSIAPEGDEEWLADMVDKFGHCSQ